ncbi:hypothetical protein ACFV5N_16240 [Streptomyces sp. NPDC059853]
MRQDGPVVRVEAMALSTTVAPAANSSAPPPSSPAMATKGGRS